MKKLSILLLLMCAFATIQAQHPINSFFSLDGTVRLETQELSEAADSVVTIQHRTEDVVWRRDIYRIIDMRQKQNYQLYFPKEPDDPTYVSLYRLVVSAVQNGLPVYRRNERILKPSFSPENIIPRNKELAFLFTVGSFGDDFDLEDDDTYILKYDSVNNKFDFNNARYENYIRNQLKYLLYEVIFFDKSTSRMYRKIVALAPLQPDQATGNEENPAEFMRTSVKFWILYDQLRPYLASHYMIPSQNEAKRVTFEEFFEKRLFSSYIVGEGNIYNRMILDYCFTEKDAKQEQERIEYELLTFEQDLWEY